MLNGKVKENIFKQSDPMKKYLKQINKEVK